MTRIGNTTLNNFIMRIPVIVLTFFYSIFLIKMLGPEGNGLFSYINTSIGFSIIVFGFNVKRSTLYHIANQKFETSKVLGYAISLHLVSIIIVAFFTIVSFIYPSSISFFFVPKSYFSVFYVLFFLASFTMQFLTELFKTVLIAGKKFKANNRFLLFTSFMQTIAYIGGYILVKSSDLEVSTIKLFTLILGIQLLVMGSGFYFFLKNYDQGLSFQNKSLRKPFIRYASLAYISQIGQFLNKRLDVWFVEFYTGLRNLGVYALASQFTNFLLEGISPIEEVLKPSLINTDRSTGNQIFSSIFKTVFWLSTLAAIILAILSRPLISLLFGEDFIGATFPLRILCIGTVFIALKRILLSYNRAYNDLKFNAYSQWLGVLITIILDILLIPKYGITGAAYASTGSYISSFVLVFGIYLGKQNAQISRLFIPSLEEAKLLLQYSRSLFSSSKGE